MYRKKRKSEQQIINLVVKNKSVVLSRKSSVFDFCLFLPNSSISACSHQTLLTPIFLSTSRSSKNSQVSTSSFFSIFNVFISCFNQSFLLQSFFFFSFNDEVEYIKMSNLLLPIQIRCKFISKNNKVVINRYLLNAYQMQDSSQRIYEENFKKIPIKEVFKNYKDIFVCR